MSKIYIEAVKALTREKNRKYTIQEMSFFERWWNDLSNATYKEKIVKLVKEKRLIIADPGSVQNDEATCHYEDIID